MELTPPGKHGGARPGAGRLPVDTVEHRVRLPRDVVSVLTALGGGRLSRGIVLAADQLRVGGACKKAPEVDSTGRSAKAREEIGADYSVRRSLGALRRS
ncbi:MAG: hypothetical protein KGL35_19385 [Bradyrhizobium sp.]|nr:hypothetical protein [Bradyrhizobium sp.]